MFEIVNLTRLETKGACKALVDVQINHVVINGIKLLTTKDKYFLGMPSMKRGNQFEDICSIVDNGLLQQLTKAVVQEYKKQ